MPAEAMPPEAGRPEAGRDSPLLWALMVLFTLFGIPSLIAAPFLLTDFIRLW